MGAWLIHLPSEDHRTPIDISSLTELQIRRLQTPSSNTHSTAVEDDSRKRATKSSSSTYGGGGGGGSGGGVLRRRQRRRDEATPSGEAELAEDTCAGRSSSAMTTASLAHPFVELGGSKLELYSMSSGHASIRLSTS
uniref:Uncharacterized protein n=1 Tax=Oryza barthii TaxID=65489 RepID=A0A0D3HCV8_9ORYZ